MGRDCLWKLVIWPEISDILRLRGDLRKLKLSTLLFCKLSLEFDVDFEAARGFIL